MTGRSDQRSADILRGGLALIADQVAAALTSMFAPALEQLAGRTDADPGAVAARRFLEEKRIQLDRGFHARLKQEQEAALARLLKRDAASAGAVKITADSLSLVEDEAVETADYVSRVARRMQGALELPLREINLVTAHLARRERVSISDDPFAPDVCMKALLEVARELGLETSNWLSLIGAFERQMVEELRRAYQKLHEHFGRHRVDVAEVRREIAARQALGRPTLNPMTKTPPDTAGDFNSGFSQATRSPSTKLPWMEEVARISEGRSTVTGTPTTTGGAGRPSVVTVADVQVSLDHMMARLGAELRGLPAPTSFPAPGGCRPGRLARRPAGQVQPHRRQAHDRDRRPDVRPRAAGPAGSGGDQDAAVAAAVPGAQGGADRRRFLRLQQHPARRLIDRMATASVGWEPYGDENDRFRGEIERVVKEVLTTSTRTSRCSSACSASSRRSSATSGRATPIRWHAPSARWKRPKSARSWSSTPRSRCGARSRRSNSIRCCAIS
jgi:hypothetical protein